MYDVKGDVDQNFTDEVIAYLNNLFLSVNYQINKAPFMDILSFKIAIDPDENVIRLVGDNPPECPSQ